jgi:hypothetical protein
MGLNDEQLQDIRERMVKAEGFLVEMAQHSPPTSESYKRLLAKADGMNLARSYLDDAIRWFSPSAQPSLPDTHPEPPQE